MTHDPVEAVVAAYLAYLEHDGPEPSLDHLSADDRRRAEELVALTNEGRGIDVYRSRPSVDMLLAGTEFESWLSPQDTAGLSIDAIRNDVVDALGSLAEPVADGAAEIEGVRSDAVVRFDALRIRIQFRDDLATTTDLTRIDPRSAAGPVFGRFPETAALVVVLGDRELSSVAIDPYDTEEFIGTPDGAVYPPRVTRPVLPLRDTLRRLVDELAPDLTVGDIDEDHVHVDLDAIIQAECTTAHAAVVSEGGKARIDAKKATWHGFDQQALLFSICEAAATGDLSDAELERRIEDAAAAA
ncbi:MAG: hypothetical protein AB7L13_08780 [Acidimicrobiia bacterium]|jgi:hypothetical protein